MKVILLRFTTNDKHYQGILLPLNFILEQLKAQVLLYLAYSETWHGAGLILGWLSMKSLNPLPYENIWELKKFNFPTKNKTIEG